MTCYEYEPKSDNRHIEIKENAEYLRCKSCGEKFDFKLPISELCPECSRREYEARRHLHGMTFKEQTK